MIEPVIKEITVAASQTVAFETFTTQIAHGGPWRPIHFRQVTESFPDPLSWTPKSAARSKRNCTMAPRPTGALSPNGTPAKNSRSPGTCATRKKNRPMSVSSLIRLAGQRAFAWFTLVGAQWVTTPPAAGNSINQVGMWFSPNTRPKYVLNPAQRPDCIEQTTKMRNRSDWPRSTR